MHALYDAVSLFSTAMIMQLIQNDLRDVMQLPYTKTGTGTVAATAVLLSRARESDAES